MFVRYPVNTSPRYVRALVCGANCARYVSPINLVWWTAPSHAAVTKNVTNQWAWGAFSRQFTDRRDTKLSFEQAFRVALLFKLFAEVIATPLAPVGANCNDFNNVNRVYLQLFSGCLAVVISQLRLRAGTFFSRNFYYSIHVRNPLETRCIHLWYAFNFLIVLFRRKRGLVAH